MTNAAVQVGAYALTETDGPPGYTASAWTCTGATLTNSTVTLALGSNATCTITTAYPGNAYLGAPGTCFKARITGLGSGYAGLTSETVFGVDQGHTAMPSGAWRCCAR